MTNYGKLTLRIITAWFILSLLASALHVFDNAPNRPPLALGLSVLLPLGVFATWFSRSEGFRQFLFSLDPQALTLTQTGRIIGFTFLVLYAYGLLPGVFALPAGWGDVAIGVTAPLVAMRVNMRAGRSRFIIWHILGIVDLTLAMILGPIAALISPHAITTSAMTVLPLSVIPTFAVPLFLILHLISIAQARRWHEVSDGGHRYAVVGG
jgi:hypothetical protein